MQNPNVLYG